MSPLLFLLTASSAAREYGFSSCKTQSHANCGPNPVTVVLDTLSCDTNTTHTDTTSMDIDVVNFQSIYHHVLTVPVHHQAVVSTSHLWTFSPLRASIVAELRSSGSSLRDLQHAPKLLALR